MRTAVLPRHIRRMAELAYLELDTPRSLTAMILLRYGEYDQLASLQLVPQHYTYDREGAHKFRRDAQATNLLRKFVDLPASFNKRQTAIDAFEKAEEQCAITNTRLRILRSFPQGKYDRALQGILWKARKWISSVICSEPPDVISDYGRFGPGTAVGLESRRATLADKFWTTPSVTSDCQLVFDHFWQRTFLASERTRLGLAWSVEVPGNRFTTVPKDCTTDRGICIEPLGNLFCQLGVGKYLKHCLARRGISLKPDSPCDNQPGSPQTSTAETLHRRLACEGSVSGEWATIDLSSASDTVATELVRDLLPPSWFRLVDDLRSKRTILKGKKGERTVLLEKFSSMGNGFTFELETLIFCGLVHGVTGLEPGSDFYVFGDDIIVPTNVAEDTLAVLRAFGFTPNPRKTFTSGPFRESCGGDYFLGLDVRPFFFKEEPVHPPQWYAVYNQLMRRGLELAAKHVLDCIPIRERRFGPARLEDAVLINDDRSTWRVEKQNDITMLLSRAVKPLVYEHDRWGSEMMFVLATYGVKSEGLAPRGAIQGLQTIRMSIS